MEGFKKLSKIACFKEGGQVGYKSRRAGKEDHADIVEDKKLIKKAFKQHDAAKHEGTEPTEIKLKKGGRAKKEKGTVKKYNTGGGVTPEQSAAYKQRVTSDMDTAKKIVAGKLPAQATPGVLTPAERRASIAKAFGPKFKKGGKVKKADGGLIEGAKDIATRLKNNIMGTPEQNAAAQARLNKMKTAPMPELKGKSTGDEKAFITEKVTSPDDVGYGLTAKKRGGKC